MLWSNRSEFLHKEWLSHRDAVVKFKNDWTTEKIVIDKCARFELKVRFGRIFFITTPWYEFYNPFPTMNCSCGNHLHDTVADMKSWIAPLTAP